MYSWRCPPLLTKRAALTDEVTMETATKTCRECQSEIPAKARKCASCGSDVRSSALRLGEMLFFVVIVLFVLAAAYTYLAGRS